MNQPFEHGKYIPDDGSPMGDNSRGATPSRRFAQLQDDGAYLLITVYAAAVIVNEDVRPTVYDVQVMTEVMHCEDLEDPGSTEITCDYEYENTDMYSTRLRDAERMARKYIRSLDIERDFSW